MAVSYTHLDVYKRQLLDSYAMVHDETNSTVGVQQPVLFQTTNISNKITYNPNTGYFSIPEAGIYTVSYTHLDVYKRQVLLNPI